MASDRTAHAEPLVPIGGWADPRRWNRVDCPQAALVLSFGCLVLACVAAQLAATADGDKGSPASGGNGLSPNDLARRDGMSGWTGLSHRC